LNLLRIDKFVLLVDPFPVVFFSNVYFGIPSDGFFELDRLQLEIALSPSVDTGAEVNDAGIRVDLGSYISEPIGSGFMTSKSDLAPGPTPTEFDTSGCKSVAASDISLWFLVSVGWSSVWRFSLQKNLRHWQQRIRDLRKCLSFDIQQRFSLCIRIALTRKAQVF